MGVSAKRGPNGFAPQKNGSLTPPMPTMTPQYRQPAMRYPTLGRDMAFDNDVMQPYAPPAMVPQSPPSMPAMPSMTQPAAPNANTMTPEQKRAMAIRGAIQKWFG